MKASSVICQPFCLSLNVSSKMPPNITHRILPRILPGSGTLWHTLQGRECGCSVPDGHKTYTKSPWLASTALLMRYGLDATAGCLQNGWFSTHWLSMDRNRANGHLPLIRLTPDFLNLFLGSIKKCLCFFLSFLNIWMVQIVQILTGRRKGYFFPAWSVP